MYLEGYIFFKGNVYQISCNESNLMKCMGPKDSNFT